MFPYPPSSVETARVPVSSPWDIRGTGRISGDQNPVPCFDGDKLCWMARGISQMDQFNILVSSTGAVLSSECVLHLPTVPLVAPGHWSPIPMAMSRKGISISTPGTHPHTL